MAKETVDFNSQGVRVVADFYRPEHVQPPYKTIVMGGGWCYVKELIQPEYARMFNDAGYAALVFDYRHLGESDGEPRQHINPWSQIEDYINAISYVCLRDDVDENAIGCWGISYSGGHSLIVGALDSRVKCIFSVVPVIDGLYNARRANSNVGFREVMRLIEEDRLNRVKTGEHGTIAHSAHPHQAPSTYPAPETWPVFKKFKETVAPNHEHWTTIQSCEYVLTYDVRPYLSRIIYTPVLMLAAAHDDITMSEIEVPAFQMIPAPRKRLVQLGGGASHMSIYDNPDHLSEAGGACIEFAQEYL